MDVLKLAQAALEAVHGETKDSRTTLQVIAAMAIAMLDQAPPEVIRGFFTAVSKGLSSRESQH